MNDKTDTSPQTFPLISVIIPCYNHGKYLKQAVGSVWNQAISAVEVIVIDDGSTDNTPDIAKELDVIYIRQSNSGLSSARNTGIKHSKGELLVFLDADDWLLSGALQTNAHYLQSNDKLAFVSGAHEKVFVNNGITRDIIRTVEGDHYQEFLRGNYIGMHASVMYRRWLFDKFLFDTSLRMCEDYDMYLKASREYPVIHHTEKLAAYRLHDENMSGNTQKMLEAALLVLKRQSDKIKTASEGKALEDGKKFWKEYYTKELYKKIRTKKTPLSIKSLLFFLKYDPMSAIRLLITEVTHELY